MSGIDLLSRTGRGSEGGSRKRAWLAAFCALLPGLGAVYNRQNFKAIVHFVVVMGFFQLTEIGSLEGFFVIAALGFYAYSIIDAYRTAVAVSQGQSAESDEERFKKSLARRSSTIGIVLLVAGLLMFVQIVRPFGFGISLIRLLPVALILAGGYLLVRYLKGPRLGASIEDESDRLPYKLIPGDLAERGPHSTGRGSHRFDRG